MVHRPNRTTIRAWRCQARRLVARAGASAAALCPLRLDVHALALALAGQPLPQSHRPSELVPVQHRGRSLRPPIRAPSL